MQLGQIAKQFQALAREVFESAIEELIEIHGVLIPCHM
jgi:hypothetical protein